MMRFFQDELVLALAFDRAGEPEHAQSSGGRTGKVKASSSRAPAWWMSRMAAGSRMSRMLSAKATSSRSAPAAAVTRSIVTAEFPASSRKSIQLAVAVPPPRGGNSLLIMSRRMADLCQGGGATQLVRPAAPMTILGVMWVGHDGATNWQQPRKIGWFESMRHTTPLV